MSDLSFRASPNSIRPLYTGGPVALTRDGEWLVTTMGEGVLVTEVRTGRGVARVKGVSPPLPLPNCIANVRTQPRSPPSRSPTTPPPQPS